MQYDSSLVKWSYRETVRLLQPIEPLRLYHMLTSETLVEIPIEEAIELGGLACECSQHSGMHLNSDYFIFEVLRDGESVSPGEPGELVITSLYHEIMPLIRYRIGDKSILEEDDGCSCGLTHPRLREIQGRLSDGLISEDDVRIPLGPIIDYLESALGRRLSADPER